ncbi:arsinothricin resistance N-acetyltransferase ArsN1 family B [Halarchaeum nitratireducens]|uniref:N-acetyltransferase n=1 Tax=Halarchaeum nitratireducens TaxID=489913 RepID=A0A830G9Z1_9EURY|nr:arsinothricin resistance N-acetyltransferase ArsN1 family B [Halarchaeum nitratireducens]GGN12733.1 N-acetyltransferase [Halarchaeum nitratireducens]
MSDPALRLATPDDAAAIRRIYAPYVAETAITFETAPPSVAACRERIAETLPDYPWLVCERDGDVVGYASAGPIRAYGAFEWAVESTVYVTESAQRRGIGRALYEALLALLDRQGYVVVYAVVTLPNEASVALHESLGFEHEGTFSGMGYKHGAWHDVGWWSYALGERPADPDPPRPLTALRGREAWNDVLGSLDAPAE